MKWALVSWATAFASRVFPCSRRSVEEHPFWRINPYFQEQVRTLQREFDRFLNLVDLGIQSPDICVHLLGESTSSIP